MKPNLQQEQELQRYLNKNLKYRETYAEFYDHILTALEDKPANISFETLVKSIINEGFGGIEGMRIIEDKYQHASLNEMQTKYLDYALDNFKFPGIFITAAFGTLVYFISMQGWFTYGAFFIALFALRVVPNILQIINRVRLPYIDGAPRSSIKKGFSKWQNIIPVIVITVWLVSSPGFFNDSSHLENTPPLIMSVLMFLMGEHSLTYYKVYRDDIKSNFIVN